MSVIARLVEPAKRSRRTWQKYSAGPSLIERRCHRHSPKSVLKVGATWNVTNTFNDLYLHELELLASAEAQMVELLPQLAKGTDTDELTQALKAQCVSCAEQLDTVKGLLIDLGAKSRVPLGSGMRALLAECQVLLKEFPAGNLRDAVMIAHMQRAEHYKMAAYASVRDYAHLLGNKAAVEALDCALKSVTAASKNLGQIAIQVDAEAYVDTRLEST